MPDDTASITRPLPPADHPASVRPGLHVPCPPARDPHWFDRLSATMNIEEVLSAARACHRARQPRAEPDWPDIEARLRLARAILLDALNEQPHNRTAVELLNQIGRFLGTS
jgi:hypothetical protein